MNRRGRYGRHIVSRVLLASAFAWFLAPGRIRASDACDRVLCYFAGPPEKVQWRIYDPKSRANRLFLSLPEPDEVRWDSSLTRVEYRVGRAIFHADWRFGARPRRVAQLPPLAAIEDWWFNPDSLCWQLYTMNPLPTGCRAELWQSSGDGMNWHPVAADTEDCQAWYYEPGFRPAFESGPRVERTRREARRTSNDLSDALAPESEGAVLIDTSATECDQPLYYVPSRTVPQKGVLFRYLVASAPEPPRMLHPVSWVDREHGTRILLCGPEEPCPDEISGPVVSEECGLLLVSRAVDITRLVDIASGRDVPLVGSSSGRRIGNVVEAVRAFWGPPLTN